MAGRRSPLAVVLILVLVGCDDGVTRSSAAPEAGRVSVVRSVAARSLAFSPRWLELPSGTPAVIDFENADIGVGHAFIVERVGPPPERIATAHPLVGPDRARYELPPLDTGAYVFGCLIHPGMSATLTVS